jgi:DNA repair ATPase RecN
VGFFSEPDEDLVQLAAKAKSAKTEIEDLTGGDERIAELEKELSDIKKKLLSAAQELTQARVTGAAKLSQQSPKKFINFRCRILSIQFQLTHQITKAL